jgi:5-methylcytosine-specific restriction endonuclease McrA
MKDLDKNLFIQICKDSPSMAAAAASLKLHFNTFKRYAIRFGCYESNQSGKGISKRSNKAIPLNEILSGLHPQYQSNKLRLKILQEKVKIHQCEQCLREIWLTEPIPLELHHKDGNKNNHKLSNLQLLCPNCHSLTDSFRGKNSKKAI